MGKPANLEPLRGRSAGHLLNEAYYCAIPNPEMVSPALVTLN